MSWQTFADFEWSGRLCLTLLHSVWQISLLAAIARGFEWLGGQRAVERSYLAHIVALAMGVVLAPLTFCLIPARTAPAPEQYAMDASEPERATVASLPKDQPSNRNEAVDRREAAAEVAMPPRAPAWRAIAPWMSALYVLGVGVMLLRLLHAGWMAHRRAKAAQKIADGPLAELLESLAHRLSIRMAPALAAAENISVPQVVGLARPTILLPAALLTGLSPQELEIVLLHELAHVRRLDLWINLLQRLAEAAFFFNPGVWLLSRRISTLREFCCDELVCRTLAPANPESRLRYAAALLHTVEQSGKFTNEIAALAASGRSPSELRRRIARLLGEPLREPLRLSRGSLLAVVSAVLLIVTPALWRSVAQSSPQPPVDPAVAKQPAAKDEPIDDEDHFDTFPITITGKALDKEGEPVGGAHIYLASYHPGYQRLAETRSAMDGTYNFKDIHLPVARPEGASGPNQGSFEIFGTAKGQALAWQPQKTFFPNVKRAEEIIPVRERLRHCFGTEDPIELDLTFTAPRSFSGRIVDDLGTQLADAKLAIRSCDFEREAPDDGKLSSMGSLNSLNDVDVVPLAVKTRKTDATGRFEFTGLPADYRWWIDVRPLGHPPRSIVVTTFGGEVGDDIGRPVYSGDFELVFPRPLPVKLRVVYGDSGEPAVKVGVGGMASEAGFWETTDDEGMIETPLPPGRYKLGIYPRYRSEYWRTDAEVEVTGESINPIELTINPAAVVEMSVVDADTGEPLAGVDVWIDHDPEAAEPARMVHSYRSWEVETRISHSERPRTDERGKMRVNFEPGKHRLGVGLRAFPTGYEASEPKGIEVDCQAGKPVSVTFSMRKPSPN